eukprot:TRINITY_DN835_c0_g1_i2.p2 TRINITY_DN835_c0_g1~~TRINITY_DN835_c0_g1_i2.p2  ORF type:complete len:184 (+),score=38.12 TRINITY_DN835_c0_g1_i2:89-640(+)
MCIRDRVSTQSTGEPFLAMADTQHHKTPLPPALQGVAEKLPPPIQEYVHTLAGALSKPEEVRARSQAAALSLLQLWAVSYAPWTSLFVALVASLDPPLIYLQIEALQPKLRAISAMAPPVALAPGAIVVIIGAELLAYVSYYLSWIVMILWTAIAAYSAADIASGHWKHEQKVASKEESSHAD